MKPWNINRVITEVNTKYGAPMGRPNIGNRPPAVTSGRKCNFYKKNQPKIYDKKVNLYEGYDNGGAYWGIRDIGYELRVSFTPDLLYVEFYEARIF